MILLSGPSSISDLLLMLIVWSIPYIVIVFLINLIPPYSNFLKKQSNSIKAIIYIVKYILYWVLFVLLLNDF